MLLLKKGRILHPKSSKNITKQPNKGQATIIKDSSKPSSNGLRQYNREQNKRSISL